MSGKGFKRERPVYDLVFADGQFEGLEVRARSIPLGEFLAFQRTLAAADTDPDAGEQMARKLADVLVSWNLLDDDDKPVPATFEGLAEQDMPLVRAIFQAWMEAVSSVPNPSPNGSNSGVTSLELSLPMEAA